MLCWLKTYMARFTISVSGDEKFIIKKVWDLSSFLTNRLEIFKYSTILL